MTYFVPVEIEIEAKSEEEAFERIPGERELSSDEPLLKPAEEVWGQG